MDIAIAERLEFFNSLLFMQTFAAALVGGLLCGVIGPYLLWRRLSMFSSSISHAALTPMAIASVAGLSSPLVLYPFSLLLAVAITRAEEKGVFESDSVLTLFFAGFMAIGVLILVSSGAGSSEAVHYLFGDVLLIENKDLLSLFGVAALVSIFVLRYKKDLVLMCLNKDLAMSEGINVRRHIYILNLLAAVTVVCLLGLVGIILTTSLIVGPALIASSVSKNLKTMLWRSALIGALCSCGGLILSVLLDWSSGPTIALLTLLGFMLSLFFVQKG